MQDARFFVHRFNCGWLVAVFALVAMPACRPSPPPREVVATSDMGEILHWELEEHILSLPEPRRRPPVGQTQPHWRSQMLEELIVARALEIEAYATGFAETEEGREFVASRIEPFLARTMAEKLTGEKVVITVEELRTFYDAHPEEFSHPEQIRVRNIYRRVARDAPPEVWEAARLDIEGLRDEIRRGANFGDLARAYSDSETAPLHGLIGRLDRGKMQPELEEILWNLDEGEVSEAIRTPVGFHIFLVEAHIGRFKMDFEEARTRLRRRLTREATAMAEEEILYELLEASGASFSPEKLNNGALEDVLFAFGSESLTVAGFHQYLDSTSFFAARDLPLRRKLDSAVRDRLYLWRARETGLDEEPAIAAEVERIERAALIEVAYRERVRRVTETLDEEELRDLYESRKLRFQTPKLLRLQILTRDFPNDGRWYAVYEELEKLAGEIRAGELEFDEAARELSSDFSAARGGDIGLVRPEALSEWAGPQAQRTVLELAPGEISDPIMIERYNSNRLTYDRAGYMLVQVNVVEDPMVRSFDEAREAVVEQYFEENSEEIHQRIRQEILRSVQAVIYPENL